MGYNIKLNMNKLKYNYKTCISFRNRRYKYTFAEQYKTTRTGMGWTPPVRFTDDGASLHGDGDGIGRQYAADVSRYLTLDSSNLTSSTLSLSHSLHSIILPLAKYYLSQFNKDSLWSL